MKTQKPQLPTVDQLEQLSHYLQWVSEQYLSEWKRKLRKDWMRGGSEFEHTYRPGFGFEAKWYLLQQLRNSAQPYMASLPDVLSDAIAAVLKDWMRGRGFRTKGTLQGSGE